MLGIFLIILVVGMGICIGEIAVERAEQKRLDDDEHKHPEEM